MKIIFNIAKTELRNLFYSPVAWFLSIAFFVQSAVFYTYRLFVFAHDQDIRLKEHPGLKEYRSDLTMDLFLGPDAVFANVAQNLYLFIPLLTMGLISKDINDGTIKLLYSSPVRTRQIVFGKYLAMMIFNLLLVSIVGVFMVTAIFNIRAAEVGILLSGALGFYLMICAYAAIGMFMSSLTHYQLVSAISSFTVLFILGRIGGLWQRYDLLRDLTYFLSIAGRTSKMLHGLITSYDVIYFVIVICMFLVFTLLKLKGSKEVRPWFVKAGRYVAVVALGLAIGYFSSRPGYIGYWDTTSNKSNTLHPNIQKIIKELGDDPLEITLYTNLLGDNYYAGFPQSRNGYLWGLWERYQRFKPDIRFRYENYYDVDKNDSSIYRSFPGKSMPQIAKEVAESYEFDLSRFKTPMEMRRQIDLQPEGCRLVMQLKYKGRTTFLRTFGDPYVWPEDQHVAAAFKRLLQAKMPKILFATGDLERDVFKKGEREFRYHSIGKEYRGALINLGFDVDTLSIDKGDIPSDISVLVLADPKTALSAVATDRIRRYIGHGGNMLIVGEPGKQEILNPILRQLGVRLMDGTLVQPSKDEMPHMAMPYITKTGIDLAEELDLLALKRRSDTGFILMPGAAAVDYADTGSFRIDPLLLTVEPKVWLKAGKLVTDSAPPVYVPKEGDIKGRSFATAVALTRKIGDRQQRIVVCGDADFMSNRRNDSYGYFGKACYSWLDYNKYPVYSPRPGTRDNMLIISGGGAAALKIIYVWVVPALLLLWASILLIRRKRQ